MKSSRVTFWLKPLASYAELLSHLDQGWTCFLHQDRFWLTSQNKIARTMIPAPRVIIDQAIATGRAQLTGMVLTSNLPFIKENAYVQN